MASLNKIMLIGNLGKIKTRYTNTGTVITNFSLACNEKNKDGVEKATWFNCVAFNKTAELLDKFDLQAGTSLYVDGRVTIEDYEKDGVKKQATKVIINDFKILSKKSDSTSAKPAPAYVSKNREERYAKEDFSDDIPF